MSIERLTVRNEDGFAMPTGIIAHTKVLEKLAEYEDAEEQGLMLRLPCKIGDTIYQVCDDIREYIVTAIGIYEHRIVICTENDETGIGFSFNSDRIGKRYFLTREEAEAALAEMEG